MGVWEPPPPDRRQVPGRHRRLRQDQRRRRSHRPFPYQNKLSHALSECDASKWQGSKSKGPRARSKEIKQAPFPPVPPLPSGTVVPAAAGPAAPKPSDGGTPVVRSVMGEPAGTWPPDVADPPSAYLRGRPAARWTRRGLLSDRLAMPGIAVKSKPPLRFFFACHPAGRTLHFVRAEEHTSVGCQFFCFCFFSETQHGLRILFCFAVGPRLLGENCFWLNHSE